MDEIAPFIVAPAAPTASRPLTGLTVLVVEDSRFACEAMRLLCLRSGARIRRADCLRSARRHLKVYRPSVAIIDLGLPDGSGADLIRELCEATPRVAAIFATSGDDNGEAVARIAGAEGFMPKPITSLALFQNMVLARMPQDRRPAGLRVVPDETVVPDPIAYRDDMAHVAEVLGENADDATLDYIAQFVSGVAHSANDAPLHNAAKALARARSQGRPVAANTAQIAGLVQDRLDQKIAM